MITAEVASRRRRWLLALTPFLSSLMLVMVFSTLLSNFFQVGLRATGLLGDILACTALAYWLYFLLRPWWLFLAALTLLVGVLYLSNGFKVYYFAAPMLPSDLQTLPALLAEVSGWRYLAMVMPLTALLLLFIAGLRWRWQTPALLLGGVLLVWGVLAAVPGSVSHGLDALFEYKSFSAVDDFEVRGPWLYLVGEYARARGVAGRIPAEAPVIAALQQLGLPRPLPAPSLAAPRDVYVFMMETLWDPALLSAAHFSRDPLAPAFRSLWRESGESKAMVPVFGGGTPNSEFEVLCGIPAYDGPIVFVTTLHRPMACLPRILAGMGYRTDAATPDEYGLWNRGNAFRLLGFQRFYDADDFDENDRNGDFMADAPLFDQVDALLENEGVSGARLVYVSTDSGHYPFGLDTARRPALITSEAKNPLVNAYANVVYYDSAELADYIARIRARDPDAVILAFGDHLPVLGGGLQVYAHSGLMSIHEEDFTPEMLETHQSTPLLLIDGRRGPVKLGHVALYELPRLVLSLLGVRQPVLADAFAAPAHLHLRPAMGRLLAVGDAGAAGFCGTAAAQAGCEAADAWSERMQTLRADVLAGSDYTGTALYGPGTAEAPASAGSLGYLLSAHDTRPCNIKVVSWDPAETRFGHGFNKRLKTGDSAFLIDYQGHANHVRVWLGIEELQVQQESAGKLSASLAGSLPLYLLGTHDLTLSCNGDPKRIPLGEFHVRLY